MVFTETDMIRVTYTRTVERFGFRAYLIDQGDNGTIYLEPVAWRGKRPHLVVRKFGSGYSDWMELLRNSPEVEGRLGYRGSATTWSAEDHWITQ